MIYRSRDTPIFISANLTPATPKDLDTAQKVLESAKLVRNVRQALHHSDRAKEVTIVSRDGELFGDVTKSFSAPCQLLESLCLRGIANSTFQWVFELPEALFSNGPLRLRSLVLERCSIPFDEALLPRHCSQLTHLELHCVGPFGGQTILDILSVATRLEILIFDYLAPRMPSINGFPEPDSKKTINLSNLKILRFSDRPLTIYSVLRYLSFPETTSLSMQCMIGGIASPPVFTLLTPHASNGNPLRSMLMHPKIISSQRGIRLLAWTSSSPAPSLFYDKHPPPKIDVQFARADGSDESILRSAVFDLFSTLPLRTVQVLTVARVRGVTPDLWAAILPSFRSLTELCVHGPHALRALCDALRPGRMVPLAAMPGGVLLPNLELLTIYEAVFRAETGEREADFDALTKMLDIRKVKGRRLPRLVLCYSDVSRKDVEELAELVGSFVWDGSMQGRSTVPVPL
ncbi:hypothetical protein EW146_g911 [Bondarzewia mesenterica]|uniref:F-box domain-containing protein n=1 Tax=Bondarzewia mesenterica TaxID=1095465 RepID=A0A4S4M5I5_9AGAM|nr:hypothetical protein EW146_g911 [Bondarzewia mesenterica]